MTAKPTREQLERQVQELQQRLAEGDSVSLVRMSEIEHALRERIKGQPTPAPKTPETPETKPAE